MISDYKISRRNDFQDLKNNLSKDSIYSDDDAIVCEGDSLEILKSIPNNSISLILIDPPYHSTKKKNIKNDTAFSNDDEFITWINDFSKEWLRILKANGSLYLFCSSKMSAKLEVCLSERFNVLSHVVWSKPNEPGFDGWKGKMKKESLRQWYAHSERILFLEPAVEGNLGRSCFAKFLREQRLKSGLSGHQLTEYTGAYGKVNHGGAVSNWETGRNVPSKEQYQKICKAFLETGKIKVLPPYEDVIRPFNVNKEVEFTDVWDFYSVRPYKGKHPAEKPLDMLEHCIQSSSYEEDIVLDCFAGSGSTAVSALLNNRKTISVELDNDWALAIKKRLEKFKDDELTQKVSKELIMKRTKAFIKTEAKEKVMTLFNQ
ncbi:site-specific DNA-methyltransferase [Winogradskyella sp.]|uniref:site-specific DNA-methyltransferase n=1 Tax=Winogradskyella sp. TaxID=1883156 RepID=UPI0025E05298|nr:site-specific DNA-methyltransferase [Winogradskyella sp.]MBT8243891.1 site-specific DNA-methyltransferase [Winogradskyella sp.]